MQLLANTRGRQVLTGVRVAVITMHRNNFSYRKIGLALNLSKTTVQTLVQHWKKTGQIAASPRSGRPSKCNERDLHKLGWIVRSKKNSTVHTIRCKFNEGRNNKISLRTIRRMLKKLDFHRRVLKKGEVIRDYNSVVFSYWFLRH